MEDIRTYGIEDDEEDPSSIADDERAEWSGSRDEEVPFHIPRD